MGTGDMLTDLLAALTIATMLVAGLRAMVRSIVRDEMGETNARLWAICKHLGIDVP